MLMKEPLRILVLAPHTDDGEWGCGASMARLIEEGHEVNYLAFSSCRNSLPEGLPEDTLVKECHNSLSQLGMKPMEILNYDVRYFSYHRQEILEDLVKINKSYKADLVFTPCSNDYHQDHQTIYNESLRAFRHANILGYELIWNNIKMLTTFFISFEERHLEKKIAALLQYESQKSRPYHNENFIRSLAYTRGTQMGKSHAEAFELIKWTI